MKSLDIRIIRNYITIDTTTKYYIFVEDIKTISENREEKLNEIL